MIFKPVIPVKLVIMNIFYLHYIVRICARYHVDRHVVKMCLETAQLLCTAIIESGGTAPYKSTHKNHPSAKWARQSKRNWKWLKRLGIALCREYTYRYDKEHKCEQIIRSLECPDLPDVPFTRPPQAMADEYKHEDTLIAYRNYYSYGKKHLHSWTRRDKPEWIK